MTIDSSCDGAQLRHKREACRSLEYYPEWFPVNDHFVIYQRHPTPCAWACLRSTCERNCEMACVWSHFAALVVTICAFVQFLRLPANQFLHEAEEKTVLSITFVCTCLCFGFSAFFHTFYHHSQRMFELTLRMDLLGIVIGMKGPWVPWIYYSFYCETTFKYFYGTAVMLNALVLCRSLTREHLLRETKARQRAGIIVLMFSMCVPGYARLFHRDGFIEAMAAGHGWGFIGLFLGVVGVFIFCTKIPESLYSGRYNRLIGSHAIFHVFSALCVWFCVAMAISLRQHRLELGDVCPS